MFIQFLVDVFKENLSDDAIVWKNTVYSYGQLLQRTERWQRELEASGITAGRVVTLEADFSPNAIALLLALVERANVVVPLTSTVEEKKEKFTAIAQAEVSLRLDQDDNVAVTTFDRKANHELYRRLRANCHPGLVLFSSGSTGESKAAVHDFAQLLGKFHVRRHNLRTLAFLLFDHIGGIDTLFYCLSNGSCVITVSDRSPDAVAQAVERHRVEVLPVTPTFLNLLFLSEAHLRYDLSSLRYVTYGTEVIPQSTLNKCVESFPGVIILQKYGTTEIGTLRSKSKISDSPWVKIGGEGFATRVEDGILHVKADSAMLGYLNAPNPFTEDGWFVTGDLVEQDGDYIRFLGRKSEIINVGGEKVYPAEVENAIQGMNEVQEVVVYGEKNPIVGNIVCARVTPRSTVDPDEFAAQIRGYCRKCLENYQIPVKIEITSHGQHSTRFKKKRG